MKKEQNKHNRRSKSFLLLLFLLLSSSVFAILSLDALARINSVATNAQISIISNPHIVNSIPSSINNDDGNLITSSLYRAEYLPLTIFDTGIYIAQDLFTSLYQPYCQSLDQNYYIQRYWQDFSRLSPNTIIPFIPLYQPQSYSASSDLQINSYCRSTDRNYWMPYHNPQTQWPILDGNGLGDTFAPNNAIIISALDGNNTPLEDNAITTSNRITFTIKVTDHFKENAGFLCTLDNAQPFICPTDYTNTINFDNLQPGYHAFQIVAIDFAGNIDLATSTFFTWSVVATEVSGPTSPFANVPQEVCNNGLDDDNDYLIDTIDSDCTTQTGVLGGVDNGLDPFGIRKIYPTKSDETGAGEEWYMDMNNPVADSRTSPPPLMTRNSDGSWQVIGTQIRYGVYTSSGYHPRLITTVNQQELTEKGYMQLPNDWKNVEMTGYVKVNSINNDDDFTWYNRGGRHVTESPCEGAGYKSGLYFSGKTRFAKEQWHSGGYSFSPTNLVTSPLEGRWVGFKYIVYNYQQQEDGKLAVKMENWIDNNNDGNWMKLYEYRDQGGWGSQGTRCGGLPDQIISWGGPIATFRWDSASSVDIKHFSVREIEPPIPSRFSYYGSPTSP